MKALHKGRQLAFGPYLSAGFLVAALWGDRLLDLYLSLMGII